MLCVNFWITVHCRSHTLRLHDVSAGIFAFSKVNQFDRVLIFLCFDFLKSIFRGFSFLFCLSSFLLCRFPRTPCLSFSLSCCLQELNSFFEFLLSFFFCFNFLLFVPSLLFHLSFC